MRSIGDSLRLDLGDLDGVEDLLLLLLALPLDLELLLLLEVARLLAEVDLPLLGSYRRLSCR